MKISTGCYFWMKAAIWRVTQRDDKQHNPDRSSVCSNIVTETHLCVRHSPLTLVPLSHFPSQQIRIHSKTYNMRERGMWSVDVLFIQVTTDLHSLSVLTKSTSGVLMNIPSRYKTPNNHSLPLSPLPPIIFNPTHPDAPDLPLFPFCHSGRAYSSEMTRKTSGSPLPGENSALLPPPAPWCFQTSDSSRFAEALMAIRSVMYLSG